MHAEAQSALGTALPARPAHCLARQWFSEGEFACSLGYYHAGAHCYETPTTKGAPPMQASMDITATFERAIRQEPISPPTLCACGQPVERISGQPSTQCTACADELIYDAPTTRMELGACTLCGEMAEPADEPDRLAEYHERARQHRAWCETASTHAGGELP